MPNTNQIAEVISNAIELAERSELFALIVGLAVIAAIIISLSV